VIDIEYLIKELPNLILYIASGFVFIKIFNFVSISKTSENFEHMLLKSLITGFILKNIVSIIPFRFTESINILGYLFICSISAYFIAMFYNSDEFKVLLKKINIRRTTNEFIWDDIIDKKNSIWVRAISNDLDLDYYGVCVLVEDYQRYPQVVLSNYIKRTLDGVEIEDCYNKPEKRVIIDTSKFNYIELIYNKDSENIKEIVKNMTAGNKQVNVTNIKLDGSKTN
jgi:hypothetical protein